MKRTHQSIVFSLSLLVLLACGPKQESESEETSNDQAVSEAFEQTRDNFFASIRQPDETAAALMSTGADFNGELLHDPSKWSTYTNSNEKSAALLGIYLSDLNYSIAYKQTDKTEALFEAIHYLSLQIGVEKSILEYLMTRYKNNIEQNDSVKATIDEMYANAIQSTRGTDREILTGIAIGTHQVEDLHLMMGIIESYPKDMLPEDVRIQVLIPLFKAVLDEQPKLESVQGFLKAVVPSEDTNNFYVNSFEKLINTYNELNVDEKIANNQGMELMSDEIILKLNEQVTAIRNQIISAPQ